MSVKVDQLKLDNVRNHMKILNNREKAVILEELMRYQTLCHNNPVKAKAAHIYMRSVYGPDYSLFKGNEGSNA